LSRLIHRFPAPLAFAPLMLLLLAAGAAMIQGPVAANGTATRVTVQEAGPYKVDFGISPAKAVVGATHVSIRLVGISNDTLVTDATVNLWATGPAGSASLGPIPARQLYSPEYYETSVPFDMPGDWTVRGEIASPLGQAEFTVPLAVRKGGTEINGILVAAVAVALLALGIWTYDRIRGKKGGRARKKS